MKHKTKTAKPPKHGVPAHHPHHKHHKKTKHLKFTVLVAGGCSLILAGVLGLLIFQQSGGKTPTASNNDAVNLLETAAQNKSRTITSNLGFALTYDTATLDASGQVTNASSNNKQITGEEFSGKELDQERSYSIVKLRLKEDEKTKQVLLVPQLTVLTNIRKDHLATEMADPANKGKSKLDVYIASVIASRTKDTPGTTASQPTDITIGNVAYKKVTITTPNSSYGITSNYQDDYYFTVQNDRAYYASITNAGSATADQVRLLESVIKTLTFSTPDQTKLSFKNSISLAAAQLPSGSANTIDTLDSRTIISVIAKNQPAVVRIGTTYCVDANLLLPDGSVGLKVQHACTAGVGSGSFVSGDGYVATNGHVVRLDTIGALSGYVITPLIDGKEDLTLSRFKEMIQYFVNARLITKAQADAFITDLQADDPKALEKLNALGSFIPPSYVKVIAEDYTYALQTSNEPMRVTVSGNGTTTFKYNKTVIPAQYVASDFDIKSQTASGYDPSSPDSDVAILKAKGTFPIVTLGSVEGLKEGASITAIGFPAFVDGGLLTKKTKTVPSVTQGSVSKIGKQSYSNDHTLILTNVPIAPGNSGGPAFDVSGKQIGLNTYAQLKCSDQQCFGNGIARDIEDYKDLLRAENITLNTNSNITTTWQEGLDLYTTAHFKQATKKFQTAAAQYPASYLMAGFADLSKSKIGTSEDKSPSDINIVLVIVAGAFVVFVIITATAIILLIKHNKKAKHLPPYDPGAPQPQPYSYPAAPVAPNAPAAPTGPGQAPIAYQQQPTANPPQQPTLYPPYPTPEQARYMQPPQGQAATPQAGLPPQVVPGAQYGPPPAPQQPYPPQQPGQQQ